MDDRLVREWVPDELWVVAEPLIPPQRLRPPGGGTAGGAAGGTGGGRGRADHRRRVAAPAVRVRSVQGHRALPVRGGDPRRVVAAVAPGGADQLGAQGRVDWSRALADTACVRAQRGAADRPHPLDRGKPGSKLPVLADRTGLPLVVGVSAATTHDSFGWPPLVRAIPAVWSRRGARRPRLDNLHAATGYDDPYLRAWLRAHRLTAGIARQGIQTPTRLGRHREQGEPTSAHLFGYHRLAIRYERHPDLCCALLTLAAAPTCYHRLTT